MQLQLTFISIILGIINSNITLLFANIYFAIIIKRQFFSTLIYISLMLIKIIVAGRAYIYSNRLGYFNKKN
jgi:hypothetical protein